uniref:Uncharacterized protein n=1 Tax=Trichuris muris TaxID=70415 RepID=A0A5S6QR81_TRIMR
MRSADRRGLGRSVGGGWPVFSKRDVVYDRPAFRPFERTIASNCSLVLPRLAERPSARIENRRWSLPRPAANRKASCRLRASVCMRVWYPALRQRRTGLALHLAGQLQLVITSGIDLLPVLVIWRLVPANSYSNARLQTGFQLFFAASPKPFLFVRINFLLLLHRAFCPSERRNEQLFSERRRRRRLCRVKLLCGLAFLLPPAKNMQLPVMVTAFAAAAPVWTRRQGKCFGTIGRRRCLRLQQDNGRSFQDAIGNCLIFCYPDCSSVARALLYGVISVSRYNAQPMDSRYQHLACCFLRCFYHLPKAGLYCRSFIPTLQRQLPVV